VAGWRGGYLPVKLAGFPSLSIVDPGVFASPAIVGDLMNQSSLGCAGRAFLGVPLLLVLTGEPAPRPCQLRPCSFFSCNASLSAVFIVHRKRKLRA
jgi:hypothetical protein